MKHSKSQYLLSLALVSICIFIFCPEAFGAEEQPAWRRPYNIIMLWFNFGLLVAVFIKFAKKPLAQAMAGVRDKIAEELGNIKNQLSSKKTNLDAEEAKLQEIQKYLEEIKAQIIAMGEKEKKKIVEQAKLAAEKMINDANLYAEVQIERAKKQLSDEMVDIAIDIVEKRLVKEISKEDNEKIISDFLVSLETTKPHLN